MAEEKDILNPRALQFISGKASGAGHGGQRRGWNKETLRERVEFMDAWNKDKGNIFENLREKYSKVQEWALITGMTWLSNVLDLLQDLQSLQHHATGKKQRSFYEQSENLISRLLDGFESSGVDARMRVPYKSGIEHVKGPSKEERCAFWSKPQIKNNMKIGKRLLELYFYPEWSLFVDQADESIRSHLDPSCAIFGEGLMPHWTLYIGDKFLRTYFVQLLHYHKTISIGNPRQKVAFLRSYKSEMNAYLSRLKEGFMMRVVASPREEVAPILGVVLYKKLSTKVTLHIMYQQNFSFTPLTEQKGGADNEFQGLVDDLFRSKKIRQGMRPDESYKYMESSWEVGSSTRFATITFHPFELAYVLEFMYGRDRLRMLSWEKLISWKATDKQDEETSVAYSSLSDSDRDTYDENSTIDYESLGSSFG